MTLRYFASKNFTTCSSRKNFHTKLNRDVLSEKSKLMHNVNNNKK